MKPTSDEIFKLSESFKYINSILSKLSKKEKDNIALPWVNVNYKKATKIVSKYTKKSYNNNTLFVLNKHSDNHVSLYLNIWFDFLGRTCYRWQSYPLTNLPTNIDITNFIHTPIDHSIIGKNITKCVTLYKSLSSICKTDASGYYILDTDNVHIIMKALDQYLIDENYIVL